MEYTQKLNKQTANYSMSLLLHVHTKCIYINLCRSNKSDCASNGGSSKWFPWLPCRTISTASLLVQVYQTSQWLPCEVIVLKTHLITVYFLLCSLKQTFSFTQALRHVLTLVLVMAALCFRVFQKNHLDRQERVIVVNSK